MTVTRRWLRNDGNGSDSLAPDNIHSRSSFLILITRFATLEDPAGLFDDTPRRVPGSGARVVHDLLRGRLPFPSPGRRMVWSCRCSRGPGRMSPGSLRGWRAHRL